MKLDFHMFFSCTIQEHFQWS